MLAAAGISLGIILLFSMLTRYINPYDFVVPSFAALIFPAAYFSLFIVAILQIGMRTWNRVSIILLLLSLPMMMSIFLVNINGNNLKEETGYRIVTYNVHGFAGVRNGTSNYENQRLVHKYLNALHPQVVCLQEYAMKSQKHARYINYLNSGLNQEYKHLSPFDQEYKGTSYIFVTASSYPIVNQGNIVSPENKLYGIYSDVRFPEGIIRVFNIHLQSVQFIAEKDLLKPTRKIPALHFIEKYLKGTIIKLSRAFPRRAYQAAGIALEIKKSPYPVIIAGDFNDTPGSYAYETLLKGRNDAAIGHSWGFNKTYAESSYPVRIDHIFTDCKALKPVYYRRDKIYLSDHFPVLTNFRFR